MRKTITAVLVALSVALLAGCGAEKPTAGPPPAAPSAAPVPAADPYALFLATRPAGSKALSAQDAQTRAALGCASHYTFSPGTVDYALRMAFYPSGCP